nr:predicted GPI-anchored protein 58 [Aegilops tauschii subsp. strangulata]
MNPHDLDPHSLLPRSPLSLAPFSPDPIWIGAAGAPVPRRARCPRRQRRHSTPTPSAAPPSSTPSPLCWIRAIPIAPEPGSADPASPALALTSASHRRPTATAFPDAPDPLAMEAPCAPRLTPAASPQAGPPRRSTPGTEPPCRPGRWILAARSSTRLRLRRTASSSSPSPPTSLFAPPWRRRCQAGAAPAFSPSP